MKVKEINSKKQVKFKLKNVQSKYTIKTAPTDPKLPALFVFCGSRGSGKTYACVAMRTHFEKKHYITRTFLICPTKASNGIFKNLKTFDKKKDVCDNITSGHHCEQHSEKSQKGLGQV